MKKILSLLLLCFFVLPIFSSDLSLNEINDAITAIIDTSYVASSTFINSENSIESIAIRVPEGKFLPDAILINEADLSSFIKFFPEKENSSLDNIQNPLYTSVRDRLIENNWKEGDAIVTGGAAVVFRQDETILTLISNGLNGIYPKVGLLTDFWVHGNIFSEPVQVKGAFILSSNMYGELDISAINLSINDKEYDLDYLN